MIYYILIVLILMLDLIYITKTEDYNHFDNPLQEFTLRDWQIILFFSIIFPFGLIFSACYLSHKIPPCLTKEINLSWKKD